MDGSEEDTPKLGLKVCRGVYETRLAKLVYAVLRSRGVEERGHLQGNWRVDLWREGLEGEAGEIIVTMATTEEAPTVCQTMYMYHLPYSK